MDLKRIGSYLAVTLLIALVVAVGLRQQPATQIGPVKLREVAQRVTPPDFTLKTVDGGSFTLASVKGEAPVIVNFFSTT